MGDTLHSGWVELHSGARYTFSFATLSSSSHTFHLHVAVIHDRKRARHSRDTWDMMAWGIPSGTPSLYLDLFGIKQSSCFSSQLKFKGMVLKVRGRFRLKFWTSETGSAAANDLFNSRHLIQTHPKEVLWWNGIFFPPLVMKTLWNHSWVKTPLSALQTYFKGNMSRLFPV